jgi:hypothetical protein
MLNSNAIACPRRSATTGSLSEDREVTDIVG